MTGRVVRPARIKCGAGPFCLTGNPPAWRLTSPHLAEPRDRCGHCLLLALETLTASLAECGFPPAVTVTPISREGLR